MIGVLGILAVICVAYYALIGVYSGFFTSFSFIWLVLGGIFGGLALGWWFYKENPRKVPLWVPVSTVTLCVAMGVVFAIVEVLMFLGAASVEKPNLDYVIVLGAGLKGDKISNSLRRRLDKAIEYVQYNLDTVLVLSGGQGPGEDVTEAAAMFSYLAFNGVPEERMILEMSSTSTAENIAYSRIEIEKDVERKRWEFQQLNPIGIPGAIVVEEEKPLEIGILTSNFHVFRAKTIGKKWISPYVYGVASSSNPVLLLHFSVREFAAILKDKLMGNM